MADDFKLPDQLGGLFEAAQKMQREMERVQAGLASKQVEASAGGGMVTAVANGHLQIVSIRIDPAVVDPKDVGMLQDLVVAAVNQVLEKAKAMAQGELAKVTGGLNLPGMPGI
jgi:hypothetical protein